MAGRSRGIPDSELFMSRPSEDCDSPTVEPLRIFKPQSPPGSERFRYPPPPSSSTSYPTPGGGSSSSSASHPSAHPSFPLPPGASSSANPLPYPADDEQIIPGAGQSQRHNRPPYPDERPQIKTSGNYNDISLRLNKSPIGETKPSLAERRGTGPAALSPTSPIDTDELFAKPINAQPKPAATYPHKSYYPPPGGSSSSGSHSSSPAPSASAALPPINPYRPPNDTDTLKMAVLSEDDHSLGGGGGMNRFASTASTSTTRASRGSPPPPETPIVEPGNIPGGGIEARYAAAGISGTGTLNNLHGPSAAAAQRLAAYGNKNPAPQQQPAAAPRPWTPTESPDNQPHGPPTVYQGMSPVQSPPSTTSFSSQHSFPPQPTQASSSSPAPSTTTAHNTPPSSSASPAAQQTGLQVSVLEQDFQRMQASTPPPAYTSVNTGASSAYPNDKQNAAAANNQAHPAQSAQPVHPAQAHPATFQAAAQQPPATASHSAATAMAAVTAGGYASSSNHSTPQPAAATPAPGANEKASLNGFNPLASPVGHNAGHPAFANEARPESVTSNGAPGLSHSNSIQVPTSPPPLPEGWISHLDQNSGQYYYIHLATQATQWEFPKGPTPLHHDPTPLSPATSTYGNPLASPFMKQSLASPMYPPTPGYAESITSMAASTTTGFMGPPPSAGVDMYKIAPTNGVYFGPYLRYVNMDVEKGIWLGSIMIVSDSPQPPTIHIHLSNDLSPNPRQLMSYTIYTHQRWTFYKYDIDLQMNESGTERWTYAVTSHLGCTRYEFVVAGRHEQGWRFLAHSGNDFSPLTSQADRNKLGGVDFMWKDILQKNVECGGFHVQLGLGDQIYADRLWREVPLLQQWLAISGRENRKNVQWTARHEEDVMHAYFHYYTSHFDQPFLREAFAQIPHVLQVNDHDIFDGFGSYPAYMQQTAIFKNIGRIAIEMYLLFQHHTTIEILRNVHTDQDLFTITGAGWHFVKYLGPAMVVIGPDCRSERTQTRVLAGPTYQGLFPKVALLPPSVQHCIWMVSVPVVYPRMETVETLANTFQTGKKAVNTTYNILGKVTSSVAGVVGGREVVQQGFTSVKKAIGKSGLMGNVLNNFGEIGISEELRDLWTHESKDLERTYLIRTLQGIAQQKGIRMTFLSGDVHCCGAGLVHDPSHPSDHKTMYQIITSPVVGAPSPTYMLKMLHNNKLLYVPMNGHVSTNDVSDTKEDMMEIFQVDASGAPREHKKLMNRRNYLAVVAYDPDSVAGSTYAASVTNVQQGLSKLSLAVDYVVQGDGSFGAPTKYGPVIIPHLEFGH
ncbi:pro40 protein [Ophiostoma piceae UAMH 11346]|uniref:Pro40 protein n=1 Tax=Ophiostoma piceae (strain UAMH 11346) TaxID=1262450 RepID=S3BRR7_OPHP1|nr:pro40 protein [Ophiostoma piceae UAMH 11346]